MLYALHRPVPGVDVTNPERRMIVVAMVALLAGIYQGLKSWPVAIQDLTITDAQKIVILTLVVPWVVLLLISENDADRRFLFLRRLQAGILALLVTELLLRSRGSVLIVWGG